MGSSCSPCRAIASMAGTEYAWQVQSRHGRYRVGTHAQHAQHTLASKLSPPGCSPPCSMTRFMMYVESAGSVGNISVSQPRRHW